MGDFDDVLERLLVDPGFKAALAADPGRALAGYRLADDERELLYAQVSTDTGGDRQVERRETKAGLFGLLSPLTGGFGGDSGVGTATGHAAGAAAGIGASATGLTPSDSLAHLVTSGGGGQDDLGNLVVPDDPGSGVGPLGAGMPDLPGHGELGAAPPVDYHPHVDVNGDGRWDQYTAQGRTDGGVDVAADMDHDGRTDFVGHDDDRDGYIDRADYDRDGDGRLETHMTDVDGDGWMDRTVIDPTPQGLRPAD
jgi:hypothetical protein